MTQAQQPEALRLAAICETKGMFPVADELNRMYARILELEQGKCLHKIAEPQKFTCDSEMRRAFEIEHGQSWSDPNWRRETGIWASAWRKATNAVQAKHGGTA